MSIIIDGTEIPSSGDIIYNGVHLEKVICDGVEVWKKNNKFIAHFYGYDVDLYPDNDGIGIVKPILLDFRVPLDSLGWIGVETCGVGGYVTFTTKPIKRCHSITTIHNVLQQQGLQVITTTGQQIIARYHYTGEYGQPMTERTVRVACHTPSSESFISASQIHFVTNWLKLSGDWDKTEEWCVEIDTSEMTFTPTIFNGN